MVINGQEENSWGFLALFPPSVPGNSVSAALEGMGHSFVGCITWERSKNRAEMQNLEVPMSREKLWPGTTLWRQPAPAIFLLLPPAPTPSLLLPPSSGAHTCTSRFSFRLQMAGRKTSQPDVFFIAPDRKSVV